MFFLFSIAFKGKDIEENAQIWARQKGEYLNASLKKIFSQVLNDADKILKNPNYLPFD